MAGRGDIKAGSAYIELLLKDNALTKGLRGAGQKLKNFGTGMATIGAGIAGMGAAITAPLIALAKSFADSGSEMLRMSQRTGISVSALSELKYAAESSGASLDDVEGAARKMQKNLTAAAGGADGSAAAFRKLGLSVTELKGMAPAQQFEAIAAKIAGVADPTKKAALTMEIFGKKGTAILPMIDNLKGLQDEARELGVVMSKESAVKAEKLHHALYNLARVSKGIGGALGSAVAPALTESTKLMTGIIKAVRNWIRAHVDIVPTIYRVGVGIGILGSVITTLGLGLALAGTVLGGFATAIGVVGTVLGVILSPIALITAALVGGIAYWALYTESGQSAISGLAATFRPMLATFQETFGGIMDALRSGELALAGQIAIAGLRLAFIQGFAALASAIGGQVGDFIGKIGGQIADGDLQGVWSTVISGLAAVWDAFSSGIVSSFVKATKAIIKHWTATQSWLSKMIVKSGLVEADWGTGHVDMKAEQEKAKRQRLVLLDIKRGELDEEKENLRIAGTGRLVNETGSFSNEQITNRIAELEKEIADLEASNPDFEGDTVNLASQSFQGTGGAVNAALDAVQKQAAANAAKSADALKNKTGGGTDNDDRVAKAQAELDELRAKAATAAAESKAADDARKEQLAGTTVDKSDLKNDIFGSFSAAALQAGGGGGLGDKIDETNRRLTRILERQTKEAEEDRRFQERLAREYGVLI